MKTFFASLCFVVFFVAKAFATEGMWIPTMLASIEDDMQAFGLQLSAEDIYSVNKSSLKDAIVQFGGGCTAEVISSKGLILTNHHCGYSQIQSHSTLESNYLRDGFWAKDFASELPNPGLTAMFVVAIRDVTSDLLVGVADDAPVGERRAAIAANEAKVMAQARESFPGLAMFIRPFNYGNSYFLLVTRTFEDVRLVGAPPSSIGKFGGDTDNWVWPRHTGDFSLFRVYADGDNNPAKYAEGNRPYEPQVHLAVSVDGVKENDFTMVFGFPGRTERYLPLAAVDYVINESNPMRIRFRETSLSIIDAAMRSSEALHIKYAAKQQSIANAYKKWIGQNIGLIELDALGKKRQLEGALRARAMMQKKNHYADAADALVKLNGEIRDYRMGREVFIEYFYYGPEILAFASGFSVLVDGWDEMAAIDGELDKRIQSLRNASASHFKDYDVATDASIFERLTALYFEFMPEALQAQALKEMKAKFKGDVPAMTKALYTKSVFVDETRLNKVLSNPSKKAFAKLAKDPGYMIAQAVAESYPLYIRGEHDRLNAAIDDQMRVFVKGITELVPEMKFSYDANSTLRLTYGKVEGSTPYDGMAYTFGTTHTGILQKSVMDKPDYKIDEKLKGLLEAKLFGPYADDTGDLPVCFTGSNHTTGGNSGSPALNARGELIGLNFDRSWESTMSDVYYDAGRCRNIMVDVRYILWVVDVYAGAGHLVDEMTLVSTKGEPKGFPMRK